MREWTRATHARTCGHCGRQLLRGDPILLIRVGHVRRLLPRCEACAGSEAPPDLPEVIEKSRTTKPMSKLSVSIPGIVERLKGVHGEQE